jgi:hypothetical protein
LYRGLITAPHQDSRREVRVPCGRPLLLCRRGPAVSKTGALRKAEDAWQEKARRRETAVSCSHPTCWPSQVKERCLDCNRVPASGRGVSARRRTCRCAWQLLAAQPMNMPALSAGCRAPAGVTSEHGAGTWTVLCAVPGKCCSVERGETGTNRNFRPTKKALELGSEAGETRRSGPRG